MLLLAIVLIWILATLEAPVWTVLLVIGWYLWWLFLGE